MAGETSGTRSGVLRAPGVRDLLLETAPVDTGVLAELGATAAPIGAIRVEAGRAGAGTRTIEGLAPDSVVEIELEGGARAWTSYERLKERVSRGTLRGGVPAGKDEVDLGGFLETPLARGGEPAPGIVSVRAFDLELGKDLLEEARALALAELPALGAGLAGEALGPWIAGVIDRRRVKAPGLGRWDGEGAAPVLLNDGEALNGAEPWLVFLHGTFSSTEGSFTDLRKVQGGGVWRQLKGRYAGRILALDHYSLSQSPVENAVQLLERLPEGARLHLVTYSRGGLVGELLALSGREGAVPGKPESFIEDSYLEQLEARLLERAGRIERFKDLVLARTHREIAHLRRLRELLAGKAVTVERYVRVAAPAAGTTLAGGKLDDWLSLVTNVMSFAGLGAVPGFEVAKGFLLAAIKTRLDPAAVPGLAAMVPGSAIVHLLNRPDVTTTADLRVIAGDTAPSGWARRLLVALADYYYGRDHDFVVDTASMQGGLPRRTTPLMALESAPEVNHFSYFGRDLAAGRLLAGLTLKDPAEAGFVPLEPPPELDEMLAAARAKRAPRADRPWLFLLPGIMGSHLEHRRDRIWLDPFDLMKGGLGLLDLRREPPAPIQAETPMARFYGKLAVDLAESGHEVKPFAFDWRLPVREEGKRLARELKVALRDRGRPVRLLAHSMGGLVVRAAMADDPDLWSDFKSRDGSRVLFLGTPMQGSFAVPRGLLGEERTIRYLELLDLTRDLPEILAIAASFTGFLEMLPTAGLPDLLTEAGWAEIERAVGKGPLPGRPSAAQLAAVRATRAVLDGFALDPARMIYVAGVAPLTVDNLRLLPQGGVEFLGTPRGDGRVPWATGIPPELTTYWIDAEHGDLCRTESAFAGLRELLEAGRTSLLPKQPPAAAARAAVRAGLPVPVRADPVLLHPDAAELAAAALGGGTQAARPVMAPIRIEVRHDNLRFATAPVLLGHYVGDVFEGSERALDKALEGRLSERRRLDLYPGPIGTAEVVLDDPARTPGRVMGAVIVGLGFVGELDPPSLRQTLAVGLRRYALQCREGKVTRAGDGLAVTSLLVGSGEAGLSVRDCVRALLEALLDTQATLEQAEAAGAEPHAAPLRFARVEIVELYEDRAHQAMLALLDLLADERFAQAFRLQETVVPGEAGRRRMAPAADEGWWRRLVVTEEEGSLRFIAPAERARVEELLVPDNRDAVDRFIERAVSRREFRPEGEWPGATLFELLLPNRLKGLARDDRGWVLILDAAAARYPWEMLLDASQGGKDPIAVRCGMLRQLRETAAAEARPLAKAETALVVGDPKAGLPELFAPLPGAKAEARQVAGVLERSKFKVTSLIDADRPEAILGALFARGYRILHLAGHGVARWTPSKLERERHPGLPPGKDLTGMVLGGGMLLTPRLVMQLPQAPELVFLNCCFLGDVEAEAEAAARGRFPELAANLATQFIRLGAKAVVAAGWAVDDGAAQLFAERLYGELLAGRTFFDAVKDARAAAYQVFRTANTWGAYQCYGDPAYRLHPLADTRPDRPIRLTSRAQARMELENIAGDAEVEGDRDGLAGRLEATWRVVGAQGWQGEADLADAYARAAAALGRLDAAIDAYETAMSAEKAYLAVRAVEQQANLRARRAVERVRAGDDPAAAVVAIETAIEDLTALARLARRGGKETPPTRERLALLASAHKRLAQVTQGEPRLAALARMNELYREAAGDKASGPGLPAEAVEPVLYQVINWLTGDQLRHLLEGGRRPERFAARVATATTVAEAMIARRTDFWSLVGRADAALLAALVDGGLTGKDPAATVRTITELYRAARPYGSGLKFASGLDQLRFVADILEGGEKPAVRQAAAQVRAIHQGLLSDVG